MNSWCSSTFSFQWAVTDTQDYEQNPCPIVRGNVMQQTHLISVIYIFFSRKTKQNKA